MIRIFSSGIRTIPHLDTFLGAAAGHGQKRVGAGHAVQAVAGWGMRPTAARAMRYAREHKLPYLALEDGFLRSVTPGKKEAPLSMVIDDVGIYYDARRASRLEILISQPLSHLEIRRSQRLIADWRKGRVSKYNQQRDWDRKAAASHDDILSRPYVLVVDQTRGDASIKYGLADQLSFERMLEAALAENPDRSIVLKTHPEVFTGNKRGYFDPAVLARYPRIKVLTEDLHPSSLLEQAEAVYVVTSQMGFEGLLWGKKVRTFGMPFYAGWGLTQDELPAPERRRAATLEQLVYASLIAYPRYINPETGRTCEVETVVDYLTLQRRMRGRFPPQVYAKGFSLLKRPSVRRFFAGTAVHFCRWSQTVPQGSTLALWGSDLSPATAETELDCVRLEDGFLRSVGLGAELVRPLSWVMDRRGIYYDATRPSDLEHLLQTAGFDTELCERAARLRQRIVSQGVTKYNVGMRPAAADAAGEQGEGSPPPGRRLILVPGQVESDASIRYGASTIRSNIDLLRAVRIANPSAYIIYKPHPDVVNGLRAAGKNENRASAYYDERVENACIHTLFSRVDEVHVLTSLTGFEALLRGVPVTTYGQPFYAGWGLTMDRALSDEVARRRSRTLTLDEMVAGALICYPTYVSRTTGCFTTPERVLDELLAWRERVEHGETLGRFCLRWVLRARGKTR